MSATSRAVDPALRVPRSEERLERHLIVLMAARLALASASLVIGLALDVLGGNLTVQEWHGFYVTVALAFLATLVYRPFVGRIERPRLFAAVNIATDVGLVSALVLFSGARESVFTFLYVTVVIYSAALFRRQGTVATALLAGAGYGAVLLAGQWGWLVPPVESEHPGMIATTWGVHAGALLLVAVLASFLVAELERTGRALHERTNALVELQTLHERTVESLMSGLLTADPAGRVTSFNLEAERISSIPRSRAVGMDVEAILPGVRGMLRASREEEHRGRARIQYQNAEGEQLFLGIGAYVLRDNRGAPSGHVVIFQDVSEVVQMERELRRSERLAAAGELSASIAHEIRNPLASISGSIQILRDYVDEGAGESKRLMEIVDREVDRLNHLITDFLQFARPGPSHREAIELESAIRDVMEMFEARRSPDVRVELDVESGLATQADAGQLRQLLWNLVLNAAQAMPDGGVLRVCAREPADGDAQDAQSGDRMDGVVAPGWVEICVMDQGVGIDPEVADRIFDPFFTTRAGGSGLGLATVHRIVADHGGFVRLECNVEPWSTIARVRLPGAERT